MIQRLRCSSFQKTEDIVPVFGLPRAELGKIDFARLRTMQRVFVLKRAGYVGIAVQMSLEESSM